MNNFSKIIRASAGTGKTYRLSLEYISILLNNDSVKISEIIVITFTKKATFEIREKVFEHFKILAGGDSEERDILLKNLSKISKKEITSLEIEHLKVIYKEILKDKSQLKINTNDSFILSIFTQIIAPYLRIDDFEIDNNINKSYLPEIWDRIFNSNGIELLKKIFSSKIKRSLESYDSFIESIINNFWIFEIYNFENKLSNTDKVDKNLLVSKITNQFKDILKLIFEAYEIKNDGKHFSDWLKKTINNIFEIRESLESKDYYHQIVEMFTEKFIKENYQIFIKEEIWNGNKFRGKKNKEIKEKLKEKNSKMKKDLLLYLKNAVIYPEIENISLLSKIIKEKYDEIKYRDKIFTYNDIQLYTYRFLYNEELSLIENGNVTNEFYLKLSTKIRYLLFDEFQDTSIIQWKIFYPIISEIISGWGVKNYGGVVIVGDEKQSIYSWRGGESSLITSLDKILGKVTELTTETLDTSFRSEVNIMNFVNQLFLKIPREYKSIDENQNWEYQEVNSYKNKKGFVSAEITSITDFSGESKNIKKYKFYKNEIEKKLIENIKKGKINPAKTAILARKNKTLSLIAGILDDNHIQYYLQSPNTVFQNYAIKPIIITLKFIVEPSIINLLKLLRSDFVAMYPDEIRLIFKELLALNPKKISAELFIEKLSDSLKDKIKVIRNKSFSLIETIKKICEQFNWNKIYKDESTSKNLFYFLEIAATFTNSAKVENNTISGFLNFISENIENENYAEKGLESVNSIQLLSIHKSKGLQFETVFVFWDFSEREMNNISSLKSYLRYESDFSKVSDAVITYSNSSITKEMVISKLTSEKDKIEKLNLFYVAITRAEKNLYLCASFDRELKKSSELSGVNTLIFSSIKDLQTSSNDNIISYEVGELSSSKNEEKGEKIKKVDFSKYLNIDNNNKIDNIYENKKSETEFKDEYLVNKKKMKGIIVHYFLSKIKYNNDDEIRKAENETLKFFANLVPKNEIIRLIGYSEKFIQKKNSIFSSEKWDKVLNEFSVFVTSEMKEKFPELTKNEYRIDRMMIDTKSKIIKIVDYKTGGIYDKHQIEDYIKIIGMIDYVKNNSFQIKGEFYKLDIE